MSGGGTRSSCTISSIFWCFIVRSSRDCGEHIEDDVLEKMRGAPVGVAARPASDEIELREQRSIHDVHDVVDQIRSGQRVLYERAAELRPNS